MRLTDALPGIHAGRADAGGGRAWALTAVLAVGLIVGLAVGQATRSPADPELMPLLRLMAAIKFAAVLGGAALLRWRLRRPAPARPAALAIGAVGLMAVSPGMVWAPSHLLVAAGLFHAGLLTLLVLGWRDRDALPASAPAGRARP